MLYAYVVELILGKRTLSKNVLSTSEGSRCDYLLGLDDYIYGHGLVFSGDNVIKATDLPRIKQIYLNWWNKNENKSLAKLRQDWKASQRPLTGTPYGWH